MLTLVYSIQNYGIVYCVLCKYLNGPSKLTTWSSPLSKISLRKKCTSAPTHIHTHNSRKYVSRKARWIKSLICKCKLLLWFAARLFLFSYNQWYKMITFSENHLRILIKFSQILFKGNLHLVLGLSFNTLFIKLSMWCCFFFFLICKHY